MISYNCVGPVGSRFAGLQLRLCAYKPSLYPDPDKLKVVLQVVVSGHPYAEDPISVDYMTRPALDNYIEESKMMGWQFTEDLSAKGLAALSAKRKEEDARQHRQSYLRKKAQGSDPTAVSGTKESSIE